MFDLRSIFFKGSNYDCFAKELIDGAEAFQKAVDCYKDDDWKYQQQMIGFDYFRTWVGCEDEKKSGLEVSLHLNNHRYVVYPSYDDNTAILTMYVPNGCFTLKKVAYPCLNIGSLSADQWNAILSALPPRATQWEPVETTDFKGKMNILRICNLKCSEYGDSKKLSEALQTFVEEVKIENAKIEEILKKTAEAKPQENSDSSSSEETKQKATCSKRTLIYNNHKAFAEAMANRIESWKKKVPFHASTFVRAYQLNATNLTGLWNGMLQADWSGTRPDSLRVFSYLSSKAMIPHTFTIFTYVTRGYARP